MREALPTPTGFDYVRAEMAAWTGIMVEFMPPSDYTESALETCEMLSRMDDATFRLTVIREQAWYDGIDWEDARGEAARDTYRHLWDVMERKGLL